MPVIELTPADEARVEEFAGALFGACLATVELANVELGVRLGLYEALAGAGPVTSAELARSAGIAPRYAREWLEQQAVAGVVEVDDTAKLPDERRFELSNAHAHVLLDDDSEACMKPCAAWCHGWRRRSTSWSRSSDRVRARRSDCLISTTSRLHSRVQCSRIT
jgi:hypothetical protein